MTESSGDRAHAASPIRRDRARSEGQIPKSFELASAMHLLCALAAGFLLLGGVATWMRSWTISTWQSAGTELSVDATSISEQLQSSVFSFLIVLAPFLILMLVLGVLVHWSQTGIVFRPQQAAPDLARLSPSRWWSHIFSINMFSIPLLGFPKTLIAFGTAFGCCWLDRGAIFALGNLSVEALVSRLFGLILKVGFNVGLVMLVLSVADYFVKRWSFERRIRMTDQEVRDELRMQNGDPAVASRRRQIHRNYTV